MMKNKIISTHYKIKVNNSYSKIGEELNSSRATLHSVIQNKDIIQPSSEINFGNQKKFYIKIQNIHN
jgi:hypothetical protein